MSGSGTAPSARRIVVRLPNWVGDVCMALPALAALAEVGELTLLGRSWAGDLLAGMGWSVGPMPRGLRAGSAAMRASRTTEGVLLTNSLGSALAARLGGVRATGYRGELRSPLLGRSLPRPRGGHEVESFWRLALGHLGREPSPPPPRLGLRLLDRHRDQAGAALRSAGVAGPFTVLCPLAVGLVGGRPKVWPSFPLLCRGLTEAGATVVACPGPGEEAACAAALPGARLLPGLGLGAYAAVLATAERVVANDSGPMHLAAAVDARTVGVFGVSDPRRTSPWGARAVAVGSAAAWPSLAEVLAALERLPG